VLGVLAAFPFGVVLRSRRANALARQSAFPNFKLDAFPQPVIQTDERPREARVIAQSALDPHVRDVAVPTPQIVDAQEDRRLARRRAIIIAIIPAGSCAPLLSRLARTL